MVPVRQDLHKLRRCTCRKRHSDDASTWTPEQVDGGSVLAAQMQHRHHQAARAPSLSASHRALSAEPPPAAGAATGGAVPRAGPDSRIARSATVAVLRHTASRGRPAEPPRPLPIPPEACARSAVASTAAEHARCETLANLPSTVGTALKPRWMGRVEPSQAERSHQTAVCGADSCRTGQKSTSADCYGVCLRAPSWRVRTDCSYIRLVARRGLNKLESVPYERQNVQCSTAQRLRTLLSRHWSPSFHRQAHCSTDRSAYMLTNVDGYCITIQRLKCAVHHAGLQEAHSTSITRHHPYEGVQRQLAACLYPC